ncbi:peptidoglycan DD-metalloendopeptidase family protein [Staphylococcus caprae]|uniref:peptidoglycan DD-metalloendopeptidase family protein n=1 Tax=Staphylococcus caprae TaxID=29380 RepID=UPI003B20DC17
MAEFNLGAEVELDVDPLKASKTTLENQLKSINRSLKSQQKAFKENSLSVDELADREKTLSKAIASQEALINKRKSSLKQLTDEVKNNGKATDEQKLKIERASATIKKSESQLSDYKRQLSETSTAYKQFGRSTDDVKNNLRGLRDQAKLNAMEFQNSEKSIKDYRNQLNLMDYNLKKSDANLSMLKDNLKEVERTQGMNSVAANKVRNALIQESVAFQVAQSRVDEMTSELRQLEVQQTLVGRMKLFGSDFMGRMDSAQEKIDQIGDRFRNLGYLARGVITGFVVSNISSIIPIAGAATTAIAGIGGATVALSGAAIGMYASYGVAFGAISLFAGQAKTALDMVKNGEMRATQELSSYKTALNGLQKQWKSLVQSNQANIFNTMTNGIKIAQYSLTTFNPFITKTSNSIARMSGKMLDWVKTSRNATASFKVINTVGPSVFNHLLNAGMNAIDGIAHMFSKFGPLFSWVGSGIDNLSDKFKTWANSSTTDNGIAQFINYTKTNLPIVGTIFGNVFSGMISLFTAFSGQSHIALNAMAGVTQTFKNWASNLSGTEGFKNFLKYINENGPRVWQLLKNLGTIVVALVRGMAPVGSFMLRITTAVTGWIAEHSKGNGVLGGTVGVLTVLGGALATILPIWGVYRAVMGGVRLATLLWTGATKIAQGVMIVYRGVLSGAQTVALAYMYATKGMSAAQLIQAGRTRIAAAATVAWTAVTKGAALATRGLGLAIRFMSGPVGWVITGIGLLVGAIIYLWKTNSTFRNIVIGAWNAIKRTAISVFGFLRPYIVGIWNGIKNVSIAVWNGLKNAATATWNGIKFAIQHPIQALRNVLSAIWRGIRNSAVAIWNGMKAALVTIVRVYVAGVRLQLSILRRVVSTVFNAIKNVAVVIWNAIKNRLVAIARGITAGVRNTFNALSRGVRAIFSNLRNFAVNVWNGMKNRIVAIVRAWWNLNRATFNALSRGIRAIFNNLRSFAVNVWNSMKNRVVAIVRAWWSHVRNTFNALSRGIRAIFNNLRSFAVNLWNSLKNRVVSIVTSLWHSTINRFNSLSRGTRNIFNAVRNFMSRTWSSIKEHTVDMAVSLWHNVTNAFNKLKNALSPIINKIKSFIDNMVDGVKSGLNKLIDGVNWVAGKLGMDKLPKIKLHTGTEHTNTTTNVVKNGAIARDTFATVGDKGKGNGPGGFRHEAIQYPNGKVAITPNRDTTAFLPKGSKVYNGAQTHAMLQRANVPRFASGTGTLGIIPNLLKGGKGKKKENNNDYAVEVGDKVKSVWGSVKSTASSVVDTGVGWAKAIGKQASKVIGDVMDWMEKPGKLVDKVFDLFGVNMGAFKIGEGAELPFNMMKGMFSKLKKGAIDKITDWFSEAGGDGDGQYIKYLDQIITPYSPNGPPPGYPFHWAHPGIDLPYHYEPVYSTIDGTAHTKEMPGGFGHYISVVGGALEVIYGHLSKWLVKNGQKVHPGTKLGISGSTGASTGPHLHYEMHKNGHPIDPVKWLKSHQGKGTSKAASAWRSDIVRAARQMHVHPSNSQINGIIAQIQRESGGNSGITQGNIGDINNLRGTPAQGLLQYVPSTFRNYAVKGHNNIKNGYDQLLAFFNNSNWANDIQYGRSGWGPRGHRRYAKGTNNARAGFNTVFEKGGEIIQMHGGETVIPNDVSISAMKQLAQSDIFNKTQSAVYEGISLYANELRNQQSAKAQAEQQKIQQQAYDNESLREQNSILKEMLYTMQDLLNSSRNNEVYNSQTAAKDINLDGKAIAKNTSKRMGFDSMLQGFNQGGAFV